MTETTIDRIVGEPYCIVYTGEKKFINQLKSFPNIEVIDVGDGHVKAKVPNNWFRFPKPPAKRNFTEEQKIAAAERMRKAREKRKEGA